jgi:hypothetical protein
MPHCGRRRGEELLGGLENERRLYKEGGMMREYTTFVVEEDCGEWENSTRQQHIPRPGTPHHGQEDKGEKQDGVVLQLCHVVVDNIV